jgi:hypothetical protein
MAEYNITEILPNSSSRQISALLTFNDAGMNAELARGLTVFQTLKDQWRVSAQYSRNANSGNWIIYFRLYYSGTVQHSNVSEQQTNREGSLKWSASLRNVSSGGLLKDWSQSTANFTFGPPDIGMVGGFDFGYYPSSHHVIWNGAQYILSMELTITIPEVVFSRSLLTKCRLLLERSPNSATFISIPGETLPSNSLAFYSILLGETSFSSLELQTTRYKSFTRTRASS